MPRGAKLTPEVEELIAKVCIEHPEWISKPKKIQQEVIRQLPDSLKVWGGPNWPGRDVIQDRLRKKIRPNLENRPTESKRLDTPWSIGALAQYPIPPEALPVVLRAFYAERSTDSKTDEYFRIRYELGHESYLTIRQALWIARLSPLFKYPTIVLSVDPSGAFDTYAAYEAASDERDAQYAEFNLVTAQLVHWARMYAFQQRRNEIMGKPLPFDTSNLDMNLLWRAGAVISPSLVSHPDLIRYDWEDTLNHLEKEAQHGRALREIRRSTEEAEGGTK